MIEGACLALITTVLLIASGWGLSGLSRRADEVVTSGDVASAFTSPLSYLQDASEVRVEHRPRQPSPAPLLLPAPSPADAGLLDFRVTEHPTFKLAGAKSHQDAIAQCNPKTPVRVGAVPSDGGPIEVTAEGVGRVGIITARHPVAKALRAGKSVLHVSISSCSPSAPKAGGTLRLRVLTGNEGASWPAQEPELF